MLTIGRASFPRSEQLATYWLGNARALYEPVNLADKILQRLENTVVEEKTARSKGLKKLRGLKRNGRIPFVQGKEEIQISAVVWWAAFAWNVLYAEEEGAKKTRRKQGAATSATDSLSLQLKPFLTRVLSRGSSAIKSLERFAAESQEGEVARPVKA